jgi:hypothetical protein
MWRIRGHLIPLRAKLCPNPQELVNVATDRREGLATDELSQEVPGLIGLSHRVGNPAPFASLFLEEEWKAVDN